MLNSKSLTNSTIKRIKPTTRIIMLDIDKDELNKKYNDGDMSYFFDKASQITDFLLTRKYSVFDSEKRADMAQECMLNLWKKVEEGKVDGSKNLMSFVWQNSTFRILEIFRKENNRNRIAQFVSLDAQENDFLERESVEHLIERRGIS